MRLDSIKFQNWQPFLGRGSDGTTFALSSNNGLKNMIIYAENSHGKSAIWQAIQFALYGKVNKRKTGWQEEKFKPYIGKSTSEEPLLNQTAKENGDFSFGIILEFNHKGDDYTLDRFVSPRKGVKVPRSNSDMQEEGLHIKNDTTGNRIKEPQNFINEILPYDLAQFFMFDGERLNEYRLLFEDTNDVELKGFIEDILRFPVLTDGTQDFREIKKKAEKAVRKYDLRSNSDKELNRQVEQLQQDLDHYEEVKGKLLLEMADKEIRLGVVNAWLNEEDKGAEALVQQTIFEDRLEELEGDIKKITGRISKELTGKWRTLLSSRVEKRLDEYGSELERQEKERERIGSLKGKVESLNGKLNGEACKMCGHIHNEPNLGEKDVISKQIIILEKELSELEKTSLTPDPHTLYTKQRALQAMSSSTKLDALIALEKDIIEKKQEQRKLKGNLKKAMKQLSAEARQEVQRYLSEREDLTKQIGGIEREISDLTIFNKDLEKQIVKLVEKIQPETETIAHKKARTKVALLDALIRVWEGVTDTHRETMRAIVEKNASEMFMSLTNKKKTYSGLRIHSDFQVEIIHKKKTRDAEAGSGGQSALMAYSILDALTRSSGIEFPMIVDTPATSIDSKNLERLFDYLFNESGKQVILLPESKELHPDIGDERYGPTCASTYQLQLIGEYEDLTVRNIRVNNTGKPTGELSYD